MPVRPPKRNYEELPTPPTELLSHIPFIQWLESQPPERKFGDLYYPVHDPIAVFLNENGYSNSASSFRTGSCQTDGKRLEFALPRWVVVFHYGGHSRNRPALSRYPTVEKCLSRMRTLIEHGAFDRE